MNMETLRKLDKSKYVKLVSFIYDLQRDKHLNRVVNLDCIDVNDWECNLKPKVYVHNKKKRFKIRGYSRCSKFDLVNAIKFHNQ